MKRLAVVLVSALTLAVAACGGNDEGPPQTSTVQPAATAAAPSPTTGSTGRPSPTSASIAGCAASRPASCAYPSRDGRYVEREGLSVDDPVTGRHLPLLVRIPQGTTGPVPVVVWMHGGGFNDNGHRQSDAWGDMLARHGYLVIHVASSSLTIDGGRKMCELAKVPLSECNAAGDEDSNGLLMVFRGFDLAAVLDDLPRLSGISVANGGPPLDLNRVAVGGWSGGSRGPMLAMGATVKPSANAPIYSRPHPRAAVAFVMSPAGPGFGGLYDEGGKTSWDTMRGPFFFSTGTNDVKPDKKELTGEIRRFLFEAQPTDGQRFLLYSDLAVGIGGHGTYNLEDLGSRDERLQRTSEAIASSTRAFLDASLRDDAQAKAWLASDNARVLAGEAEWLAR